MKISRKNWKLGLVVGILTLFLTATFVTAQDKADNTYHKAVRAYAKKDFRTAAKYFKEFVEKKPDPYAYYLLGYALYEMKKHPESAKYFKEAYILDPNISPSSVKEFVKKKS